MGLSDLQSAVLSYCRKREVNKECFKYLKEAYEAGFDKQSDGCTLVPDLPLKVVKNPACIMHDWLYTTNKVTRKEADRLFGQMLRSFGYPVRSKVWYLGVRAFGWIFWRSKRKKEKSDS